MADRTSTQREDARFCGYCGTAAIALDAFCRSCGRPLLESAAADSAPPADLHPPVVEPIAKEVEPPPVSPTVAQSLEWCRSRAGEGAIEHLLRIAEPPANEGWDQTDQDALYRGFPDVAGSSISELVASLRQEAPVSPGPADEARNRSCDACFAATHPYLESCVGCGRYLGVSFKRGEFARTSRDVLLAKARSELEMARILKDPPWDVEGALAQAIFRGCDPAEFNEREARVAEKMASDAEDRYPAARRLQLFTAIEFRYLGGLRAYPAGADIRFEPEADGLRMTSRGAVLVEVPYYAILGAWPFPDDIDISRTQLGFFSSGLFYLPNPTYRGGGLGIAAVVGGQRVVLAVGNRQGWLTKKAPFAFYSGLAISLAGAIEAGVRGREAQVGPDALAAELDLTLPELPD